MIQRVRSKGEWRATAAKRIRSGKRLPQRLAHAARVALDVVCWAATFQLRAGLRRREYVRLIRRSGLFETHFYLSQCRDDPDAQKDPITHYVVRGAAQGLDPNRLFDTSAYVEQNPAAARAKNPLVHLIRSRREALKPRFPDASSSSIRAVISPGEALLLSHPFRAPATTRSDRERRVLVVDRGIPMPDQDAASARMFAIVTLLREMRCAVTFVSDSTEGELGEHHGDALRLLGIAVHHGFPAALAHLAAQGHQVRWALLSRPEQAFRYLPAVRAYAPQATVIYDMGDRHSNRLPREAEVAGDAAAREQGERFRRIEQVSAACSDVVIATKVQERDLLLCETPGTRVEVIPNVPELSPELVKGRLESILSASWHDVRSEPSTVDEGSAA